MKSLNVFALLFVLTVLPVSAQLGPDGTGVVNGYRIGPFANLSWTNLRDADPKETTTIVMGTYGFAYLVARRYTSGCRRSGFRGVGSVTAVLPAAGGY